MMVYYHSWNVTENLLHVANGCSKEVVADSISLKVSWRTPHDQQAKLLCGLAKHPTAPPLCCVDLSTTVLGKNDLSFVDSFEGFRTAPQPDRVYEIRCVMIMMVVGDGYDLCLVCCLLNSFPGLISCSEFSWMRHQPEPRSQRHTGVQQDRNVLGLY